MTEETREPEAPLEAPPAREDAMLEPGIGIATKLIVALTVIVMLVLGTYIPISLSLLERQRRREVVLGADQLSKAIVSATWNAMLADNRGEAYRAMKMVAQQPGIEKIRIFNKEGRIMFSSGPDTGSLVDKHAEACDLCHESGKPLVHVDLPSRARLFPRPEGGRILGLITPIYNEPHCSVAPCHAHPPLQNVLGVVDVNMSMDRVDSEIASARTRALLAMFAIVGLTGVFIAFFVRRFVGRPIRQLIAGTRAVSAMDLDQVIEVQTRDEIGELAWSFNVMRTRLKGALSEINEFTGSLEKKVEERTLQLRAAQETLVRKDRLASLGQLSASVAHEINNPLSGVLNYTMLMDRILKPDGIPPGRVEEFRGYLSQVAQETARVGRIVTGLLSFARQGKPQRTPQDLNEMVQNTAALAAHKLEMGQVTLDMRLDDGLPPVPCDGSQIRQVVMNLVMNAAEAMPGGGTVTVRTSVAPGIDAVVLEVSDTGVGIDPEALSHVFDPFFTTKGEASGVGLGLTVVYGIVTAHGGTIELSSQPGSGTVATVSLPLHPSEPLGAASPAGTAASPARS